MEKALIYFNAFLFTQGFPFFGKYFFFRDEMISFKLLKLKPAKRFVVWHRFEYYQINKQYKT